MRPSKSIGRTWSLPSTCFACRSIGEVPSHTPSKSRPACVPEATPTLRFQWCGSAPLTSSNTWPATLSSNLLRCRRQLRSGRRVCSPTTARTASCVWMGSTLCPGFARQARAEMGPVRHDAARRTWRSGSKRCAGLPLHAVKRLVGAASGPHFGGRSRR